MGRVMVWPRIVGGAHDGEPVPEETRRFDMVVTPLPNRPEPAPGERTAETLTWQKLGAGGSVAVRVLVSAVTEVEPRPVARVWDELVAAFETLERVRERMAEFGDSPEVALACISELLDGASADEPT